MTESLLYDSNGRRTSKLLDEDDIDDVTTENKESEANQDKFFNLSITSPVNPNDMIHSGGGGGGGNNNNNNNNQYPFNQMSLSHSHESQRSESFASHSREDSNMSQISASADEIVTSLVMGIDRKLDEMLTPVVSTSIEQGYNAFDIPYAAASISENDNHTQQPSLPIANQLQDGARDTFKYVDDAYVITPSLFLFLSVSIHTIYITNIHRKTIIFYPQFRKKMKKTNRRESQSTYAVCEW